MRFLAATAFTFALFAPVAATAQGGGRGSASDSGKVYPLDRVVAVIGKRAITLFELNEVVNDENQARIQSGQAGFQGDTLAIMHQILSTLIDGELLKQKALELKLAPPEAEINAVADDRIARARRDLKTEQAFRDAIKQAGFATPEAIRAHFIKQERDSRLQRMALDTLRTLGLMPKVSVSEKDVEQAFDSVKKTLEQRGPTITFRQIILSPWASDSSNARAKAVADSLRELINSGASWDSLARKFSADSAGGDSASSKRGGDLGWMRRGAAVTEFDSIAFNIQVGTLSPVFKTQFGYHFLKVERARPGEVRVRHILIIPGVTRNDVPRAKARVDSLMAGVKAGANFDSLSDLYHEAVLYAKKTTTAIGDLPDEYVEAIRGLKAGDYTTFQLVDPRFPDQPPKSTLLQLIERNDSGEYTLGEMRSRLRERLQQAGSMRRMIDILKAQTYVSVRLDKPSGATIRQ